MIGGVSEVAAALGVSPQRLRVLRGKYDTFPAPVADLSAGPVWDLDAVHKWNQSRPGPGRPRTSLLGGRFDLESTPIGSGGFADVYRAPDRAANDEFVAVKVLREPEEARYSDRFERELRLLEQLSHPNVIQILDSGVDPEGRPWYAMPLAVGSLEDSLRETAKLVPAAVIEIAMQICQGLAYLHSTDDENGECILHRDLCPNNILRTGESTWKIADFGLAREAERRTTRLTTTTALGHIHYIAPEQLDDMRNAGIAADIYALGRTLQAMVVGRTPKLMEEYEGDHLLGSVIRRATRPDPSRRYGSVDEIRADLIALTSVPSSPWESPSEQMERLVEKIRDAEPNSERTVAEFRDAVLAASADDSLLFQASKAFPDLDRPDLEFLWTEKSQLREMIRRWSEAVRGSRYGFSFTDRLAAFAEDLVGFTERDDAVLEAVVVALVELGHNHNRWFVRDTLTATLQQVREQNEALTVCHALRECHRSALEWSLTDFALKSFHPTIQSCVAEIVVD